MIRSQIAAVGVAISLLTGPTVGPIRMTAGASEMFRYPPRASELIQTYGADLTIHSDGQLPPPPDIRLDENSFEADRTERLKSRAVDHTELLVQRVDNAGEFRLAGEFERQSGLLLSCQGILCSSAIRDSLGELSGRLGIIALYGNDYEYEAARETLADSGISVRSIRFLPMPHDTMWTRDYGPVVLSGKRSRHTAVLDTLYLEEDRAADDVVPLLIAESAGLPVVDAQLAIEGGNLISNGQGLLVTTTKTLDDNPELDDQTITDLLCHKYGGTQVAYLEPLADEATGHVDMFATFTSSNCIVVGRYAKSDDAENADLLDRNAKLLAGVRVTRGERLEVRRIPMPSNSDGVWRTYTNVVYANQLLLMPVYSETDAGAERQAVDVYRSLLPGWKVMKVNADDLITSGGALHCAMMNLGRMPIHRIAAPRPLPRRVALQN